MKFNLSADYMAAAMMFRSKEETRYYLNGVFVMPAATNGVLMIATDGHALCVLHDPAGIAERSAILRFNDKSTAMKTARKDVAPRRVIFELGEKASSTFIAAAVEVRRKGEEHASGLPKGFESIEEIDGTFPDWWWVVPDTWGSLHPLPVHPDHIKQGHLRQEHEKRDLGVNPDLISRCTAAVRRAGWESKIVRIDQKTVGDPMIVTTSFDDGIFVVMPARPPLNHQHRPAWLQAPAEPEKEEGEAA